VLRVDIVQSQPGPERIAAEYGLGIKGACHELEIGTGVYTAPERVSNVENLPVRQILLTDMVEVGGIGFELKFAPAKLFSDIAGAEVDCIDANCPKVLERGQYAYDGATGPANDLGWIGSLAVDNKLGRWLGNDIAPGYFYPINVGAKTVSPAPPAMFWISCAWGPNTADIVAVAADRKRTTSDKEKAPGFCPALRSFSKLKA
jgi:hypothetical protein